MAHRVWVDLRHDERNVGVHPERVRLVDHRRARLHEHRRVLLRLRRARRAERDLDALEGGGLDALDADRLAPERHRLADRALRGERPELADGELPLLENPERHLARGTRGADRGDRHPRCHQYWASSALTIRSAISRVPTVFVPTWAMSAVRCPSSRTLSTARSTRSASFSRPSA